MSVIAEIIDTLENKVEKLILKLDQNTQELKINKICTSYKLNQTIEALKSQYETLKIANSLLGSDDNKRDTKLKINSLIEIDYCIAQLSD
jgi:hypothetical protein